MADEGVTERCGLGVRCESCGNANGDLRIKIYNILGASMCLTRLRILCDERPSATDHVEHSQKLVAQHSQHLAGFATHHPRG